MKKVFLFLLFLFMFIPGVLYATTVTTEDELVDALGDYTINEVKLGANISISQYDFMEGLYSANIHGGNRTLDLNGYTLTHIDGVTLKVYFMDDRSTFTITDSVGTGKIYSHSIFLTIDNENVYEDALIKLKDFDYENTDVGDEMIDTVAINTALVLVEDVDFFYPKNSPFSEGYDLIIKSLTVTPTDYNPVGFYNDGNEKHLNEVVHQDSNVYCDGFYQDDWENTWARDVFLGAGATGKIVIKDHCTISFDSNGGSEISDINVPKGTLFGDVKPDNPTKGTFTFYSWYEDNNTWKKNFVDTNVVDKDITLYARYGKHFNLFIYNRTTGNTNDGGKIKHPGGYEGLSGSGYGLEGEPMTFEILPDAGMIFIGWAKGSTTGTIVSEDPSITFTYDGDLYGDYYAILEKGIKVTFNTNGGSEVDSQIIKKGTTATLPTQPDREGYRFDGWYTDNGTFQNDFNFETVLNEDITIYAKWVEIIKTANVNFTIPYANYNPDMNIVSSDPTKYTVELTSIYDNVDGYPHLNSESVYELGHTYTYRIRFEACPGYKLEDDTVYTFNGVETESYGSFKDRQYHYVAEVKPEVVKPVVTIKNDNNKITLTWENQEIATKYIIFKSEDGKKFAKETEVTDATYVEKSLKYGNTYYYKVKACEGKKCSGYSDVVSKKIKPNKVNLSIKSAGSNNVKLNWEKVKVTGYRVYQSTDSKEWTLVKDIASNDTLELNVKSLKANKTYYFRARAYKTVSGEKVYGSYSTVVSVKTAPAAPKVTMNLVNYQSVSFEFASSKGATYYNAVGDFTETYDSENRIDYVFSEPTVTPVTGETGKTFYIKIRACNKDSRCSGWTKASLRITPTTPSIKVESTTAKKVTVKVGSVEGADGYMIYRSTSKNSGFELIKQIKSSESLTFTDKTKSGVTYYYKVKAFTRDSEGVKVKGPYSGAKKVVSK